MNVVTARTGQSRQEAEQTVANWEEGYQQAQQRAREEWDQAKVQAEEKAREWAIRRLTASPRQRGGRSSCCCWAPSPRRRAQMWAPTG